MRVLTLTQPWATLVAIGAKTIETRSWPTTYTGECFIHAAKGFPRDARLLAALPPFDTVLQARTLPLGCVVASARISTVFHFTERTEAKIRQRSVEGKLPPYEADFGDYSAGRYGFVFTDIRPLPTPIEVKGALGLWYPSAELLRAVDAQLEGTPA